MYSYFFMEARYDIEVWCIRYFSYSWNFIRR